MELKLTNFVKQYAIIIVLIALIAVFSILSPAFSTINNAMNIIRQISVMGIVAVGFTFVLIGGGLDLSVGSQIAIMNVSVALMIVEHGVNPILAVIIGIVMTTVK